MWRLLTDPAKMVPYSHENDLGSTSDPEYQGRIQDFGKRGGGPGNC